MKQVGALLIWNTPSIGLFIKNFYKTSNLSLCPVFPSHKALVYYIYSVAADENCLQRTRLAPLNYGTVLSS